MMYRCWIRKAIEIMVDESRKGRAAGRVPVPCQQKSVILMDAW